jgi:diguanylate cyclase (GGDEF)-like protein
VDELGAARERLSGKLREATATAPELSSYHHIDQAAMQSMMLESIEKIFEQSIRSEVITKYGFKDISSYTLFKQQDTAEAAHVDQETANILLMSSGLVDLIEQEISHISKTSLQAVKAGLDHYANVIVNILQAGEVDKLTGLIKRFDTLTNLVKNEFEFLEETNNSEVGVVLVYIDIDKFKEINDRYGHDFADLQMQRLGQKLLQNDQLRDYFAARPYQAGDEFLLVFNNVLAKDANLPVERLLREIINKVQLTDSEGTTKNQFLHASLGYTFISQDEVKASLSLQQEFKVLMERKKREAELAGEHAKRTGRNKHEQYTPDLETTALDKDKLRALLERGDLGRALEEVAKLDSPAADALRQQIIALVTTTYVQLTQQD